MRKLTNLRRRALARGGGVWSPGRRRWPAGEVQVPAAAEVARGHVGTLWDSSSLERRHGMSCRRSRWEADRLLPSAGNVSQVDRLWTFLPLVYSVHFTFWPKWTGNGPVDERMLLVLGLQLLWSARCVIRAPRPRQDADRLVGSPRTPTDVASSTRTSLCAWFAERWAHILVAQELRGLPLGDRSREDPRLAVQAQCVHFTVDQYAHADTRIQ